MQLVDIFDDHNGETFVLTFKRDRVEAQGDILHPVIDGDLEVGAPVLNTAGIERFRREVPSLASLAPLTQLDVSVVMIGGRIDASNSCAFAGAQGGACLETDRVFKNTVCCPDTPIVVDNDHTAGNGFEELRQEIW
jgi:hypothetical protein